MKFGKGVAAGMIPAGRELLVGKGASGGQFPTAPGAGAGEAPRQVFPNHPAWWLNALPPESVTPVEHALSQGYNSSASEASIGTYVIPDGETMIMLRYRFFAELPDVGGRFVFCRQNDLWAKVSFRLQASGQPLGSGTVNKVSSWVTHDDLLRGYEPVPLYVRGPNTIQALYTVVSNPVFTVGTVGFYLYGARVPTDTLERLFRGDV